MRGSNLLYAIIAIGLLSNVGENMKPKMVPRGIRNNNPLNIRKTDTLWVGQKRDGTDKSFVEFEKPEFGYRAATKILRSYAKRGIVTLEQIIKTWAPHTENPTDSYVRFVVKHSGLRKDTTIKYDDYRIKLFRAMTLFENGMNPFTDEQIRKGISLA